MASQSARHAATVRKVQHMLDVTVDDTLRELFVYVDDVVPGLVAASASSSSSSSSSSSTTLPTCVQSDGERAAALRTALDRRAVQMHSEFVDSFGGLCAAYEDAATHIRALHELCAQLQRTLQARASDVDALCGSAAALQQTLQQTQQHERDMREFATKYSFGDAEQRTLADGDVDVDYLDVLERVCLVHRQSRALLLSRTHAASASAVMEATYTALVQATERVLRYVLAEAVVAKKPQTHYDAATQRGGSSSSSGGGSSHGGGRGGAGGAVSLSADVPEVTSFYVRCMCVLREHTPQQWRRALDEVARLRRQSVLRRYYHLLTTGSATTTAGTYHVQHARGVTSSSRTGSISGSEHASDAYALSLSSSRIHDEQQQQQSHGMGTRPLEAALHDPVYFYSSLFAWLHQTMVEEDELFAMFLAHDTPHARTPAQDDGGGGDKGGEAHVVLTLYGEDADATATMAENNDDNGSTKQTKQTQGTASSVAALRESLLDVTFAGVCPHMLTALEGVLERLSHSTHHIAHDAVTAATATRAATANNSSSSNNNNSDVTAVGDASRHDGNDASSTAHTPRYTPLGPRGLTGGLTRLLSAARRRALGARAASSAAAADDDVVDTDDATATMTSSNSSSEHGSGGGGVTAAAVHADSDAPLPAALQRYTHVTTRAQQESLAAAAMHKGVRALLVAATLQQLCAYYVASTLLPLLGARAALTTLVAHTARSHLQHLFDTHAASLSLCVFDSVAGVVHRTTLLRRLAAVHEATTTAAATAAAAANNAVRDDGSNNSNNNNNNNSNNNSNTTTRRCFVADFVFAHVTDDSVNNATTTAATTTAASSMTMSSTTMTTSAPHASSLTQQQQRTSAHLLLRTLLPLVLPLSPEAHTLLRTLDTVLSEAAERADMLEALQAKHAARTAATTTTTHDDSSSVVRDTATPLFVLLARRLCDAPHALLPSHSAPSSSSSRQRQQQQQRQGRVLYAQRQTLLLRRALDDVCLRIMQLNMWCALAAVLSRHEAYIRRVTATSSSAATTTTTTTTRREQQADDKDSSNNNEDAECDEDMAARVQHCIDVTVAALIDDVCASAEAHYFAPVTPPLLLLSSSTTRTTTHKALLLHKRVRTRLRQLQSVYTLVASLGKLPPLQLLGAIADATVRERVHAAVTRHVLAVYARVYDEVLTHNSNNNDDDATVTAEHASTLQHDGDSDSATAQLTDDERATLADMAPDKLQLLMDA